MSVLEYRAEAVGSQAQAYTQALIDLLGERDPLAVLRETPAALASEIAGVRPELLTVPEAPGKWSMVQMVQHLADSDLMVGYRVRMILAHDRPTLVGYDQDLFAERLRYSEVEMADALADFTAMRHANLRLLERVPEAERARVGVHVELGEVTLFYWIQLYAGHDLAHLRQIRRIRAAVGA